MFSTKNLTKVLIFLMVSLAIPSVLSVYKDIFDEAVAAARANHLGSEVLGVQTTNNPGVSKSRQRVLLDLFPQRSGQIRNLSQRPFRFPGAQAADHEPLVNNKKLENPCIEDCHNNYIYKFVLDKGKVTTVNGEIVDNFFFAYAGVTGNTISFYNGNDFDMLNVKLTVTWLDEDGNEHTSFYEPSRISSTDPLVSVVCGRLDEDGNVEEVITFPDGSCNIIKKKQFLVTKVDKPGIPLKSIKNILVQFTDVWTQEFDSTDFSVATLPEEFTAL